LFDEKILCYCPFHTSLSLGLFAMGAGTEDVDVMFKRMRFWELRPWLSQNQVTYTVLF
jgi:hypothetical protein